MRLSLNLAAAVVAITATGGEARLALRNNNEEDNQWPDWGNLNPNDDNNCYQREILK